MTDLVSHPHPSKVLNPAEYPEFKGETGPATEWNKSATHLQARPVGGTDWVDVVALSELKGEPGEPGVGTPGADGNTILSGDVDPTDEGEDGDYYINRLTTTIFGPKATTWPAGVPLKGEDGDDAELPAQASNAELLAGTETAIRSLSPADLVTAIDEHGGGSGDTESIYYQQATADVTIDWANAPVQYLYVNPAGASIQITMPADPGALSQSGILFVKNNTGKAHTWNTSPLIRFADQADADTVPTPAAVGYYTRYTAQWMDNNAGTGAWWITVAGRDTA